MAKQRPDDVPDRFEGSLEKWELLRRLREQSAQIDHIIATKSPPRPRPWHTEARADQLAPPGDWNTLLILAGRGWGKSRTGAEWLAEQAATHPGTEWAIVAPTWRDCKTVCLEGSSGLFNAFLPGEVESINSSELTVRLTNGTKVYGFSADGYERIRGRNLSGAWVDEAGAMATVSEMFSEALLPALRIGKHPRVLITTTPRSIPFLRELVARDDGTVHIVRGKTWDNADNLSEIALAGLRARYEGTRLGAQELEGILLDDVEGALWTRDMIEDTRVKRIQDVPQLVRIVVGIDPAVTSGEDADDTGIIVAGKSADGHLYVLEDLTMKGTPRACMSAAVVAYKRWNADRIVAEVNNGGDYLETVLRTVDENASYRVVRATRGKTTRAEPVSALWEQKRGHIVGCLPKLEDQMCVYTPDGKEKSPDNMDAMVWCATELNVGSSAAMYLASISRMCRNCDTPNKRSAWNCVVCGQKIPREDAA